MAISLANTRIILDNILGGIVTGITDSAGSADATTAIDSNLAQYPDGYFKDWFLYMTVAAEERAVKEFLSPSGTLVVNTAFSALVATAKAYRLQRFSIADKLIKLNDALYDSYPYFYNPNYSTALYGQNAYGEDPNEFNKLLYTVPSEFIQFPDAMWLFEAYTGEHDGAAGAAALTDSSRNFIVNELVDSTLYNKTDASSGTVTANTSTTVTATLAGGTNTWAVGDEYVIARPDKKPKPFYDYTVVEQAPTGSYQFYASISEDYILGLVGKAYLTQFTTDASLTELSTAQARIVCYLAASGLYEMYSSKADAQDSGRFEALATKRKDRFDELKVVGGMPALLRPSLDWSWLNG